ncbi:hypothetical protein [Microbacterium sp. T2.11-28]|uniref:hypothetical protein n=1 Tax=unclassified Microbacterium TaxID=2609290 RepID=UPI002477C422|nr:hypothetical protein [Microbacterium sp. T2.11-28]CAI9392848.1 hypothetical protein MICABA_02248 [Microbacterium sp. T2.11-28]
MAGFWGNRKKEREAQAAEDAELTRRASSALVAADERIRTTSDELVYAEAELGADATRPLREALDAVRQHLAEAFHLHQLNHDEIPDTSEELQSRGARILQLCEWAQELLDDRTEALAGPIERARRAPEIIDGIRRDVERLSARLPQVKVTIDRLTSRYSAEALRKVSGNHAEASQLLDFASHGADISERRRESGQREQANLALETAIEAVRRATTLIDAVDSYEVEALRAESTLDAIVLDSREDLAAARDIAGVPAVAGAMTVLEKELGSLAPAGTPTDPFAELTRLREANAALDVVVAKARERAARPVVPQAHVWHAIDDADRQLGVARSVISGHRGWIGADARTRLAEAERIRLDLAWSSGTPVPEDDRDQAMADARRCGQLASEALQLAQRDIDSSRPQGPGGGNWGGGGWGGGNRGGGGDVMGGILGGLVIGSILDGIFD